MGRAEIFFLNWAQILKPPGGAVSRAGDELFNTDDFVLNGFQNWPWWRPQVGNFFSTACAWARLPRMIVKALVSQTVLPLNPWHPKRNFQRDPSYHGFQLALGAWRDCSCHQSLCILSRFFK
ncbi:hypothetical protein BGS_1013 [Beggiatoa sp. SS]|nr:hypothetical protein BGS_1013 [Beggiatoa sp. SS]